PRNEVAAQNSPGSLRIANAGLSREAVDGNGEFRSTQKNFFGEQFRNLHCARTSEKTARAVANKGPAFKENAPVTVFPHNVKAAFEADKIAPSFVSLRCDFRDRFGALPSSEHQLFPVRRRVTHAAFHFDANYFKCMSWRQKLSDRSDRFLNRAEFRLAGTSYGNENLVRVRRHRVLARDCTLRGKENTRSILRAEENSLRNRPCNQVAIRFVTG